MSMSGWVSGASFFQGRWLVERLGAWLCIMVFCQSARGRDVEINEVISPLPLSLPPTHTITQVDAMALAWRENLDAALEEIRRKNGTTWDLSFSFNSYNDPKAGAMTVPKPSIITKATCAAVLARECAPSDRSVEYSGVDHLGKTPKLCCCVTSACPGPCPADCPRLRDIPLFYGLNYTSKSALSDPDPHIRLPMLEQDLAGFHLVRGDYAWLGFGFLSCHPDTNYTLPQSMRNDPGTPLGQCYNAGGTVFRRKYTRADVELDCSEWRGTMKFHN